MCDGFNDIVYNGPLHSQDKLNRWCGYFVGIPLVCELCSLVSCCFSTYPHCWVPGGVCQGHKDDCDLLHTSSQQTNAPGVEYAFGAHNYSISGVLEVEPRQWPGSSPSQRVHGDSLIKLQWWYLLFGSWDHQIKRSWTQRLYQLNNLETKRHEILMHLPMNDGSNNNTFDANSGSSYSAVQPSR